MYVPTYSEQKDFSLTCSLIKQYPFGTMITNSDEEINANHYPFLLDTNEEMVLWTHLAKSNPQWKHFQEKTNCLLIFTGPHAYISPIYYENKLNVPTWNYTAVHLKCEVEIIEDIQLQQQLMRRLVANFEQENKTNWQLDLPEEFNQKLSSAIIWLKFKVKKIDAKFKLSQNREKTDYLKVLNEFSTRQSENDQELYKYMKLTMPEKMK